MSGATDTIEITGSDGEPVMVTFRRRGVREILDCLERFEGADENIHVEEPGRFKGNRRARRKAAAQARKATVPETPLLISPDAILSMLAEAKADVARNRRIAEHMERTRELQAVQALHGVIIDTATPEQRAAREAAWAEECRRIEEATTMLQGESQA